MLAQHQQTLDGALDAIKQRQFWTVYPEIPSEKIYGENAKKLGKQAFEARLNRPFELDQPGCDGTVGAERSPYGFDLTITYPKVDADILLPAMAQQIKPWRDAGIERRTEICLEILQRLNQASFEMGHSTMHTSGQSFVMAFQAGGPHAQDRGLEALAYAYRAMTQTPATTTWVKPQGRQAALSIDKTYTVVPRGLALVVGCATFPTWNSYPGLFASLVTGNPVVVKPHPQSILPLAITVEIGQQVLKDYGFAPHILSLLVDEPQQLQTKALATHELVKLVDFTGSSGFGHWLEDNARQARVYTEKAGVNSIIIDSTDDLKGMADNLAFSVSLYSGQMCTTPQNIYIPAAGIETEQGHMSFDQVAQTLIEAINHLLAEPQQRAQVLGCIVSEHTRQRLAAAAELGEVLLASQAMPHQDFEQAHTHSPVVIKVDVANEAAYMQEQFGPLVLLIATESSEQSVTQAAKSARQQGAITWGVYSSDEAVLAQASEAALEVGVALSCNLCGGLFVNQAAAFSDFHATGANPAANACLTDDAFVSGRFNMVQSRRPS